MFYLFYHFNFWLLDKLLYSLVNTISFSLCNLSCISYVHVHISIEKLNKFCRLLTSTVSFNEAAVLSYTCSYLCHMPCLLYHTGNCPDFTWNISSWKGPIGILKSQSLPLVGLGKTKLHD